LTPRSSARQINATPTAEGEQPGMGAIIGALAVTGAGLFAAQVLTVLLGFPFMSAAYGWLTAIGALAGCLLGAVAGAKLEDALTRGLPRDEFYYYKNELAYGRSVIVVMTDRCRQLRHARMSLEGSGAAVLDAARKARWIGLRALSGSVIGER